MIIFALANSNWHVALHCVRRVSYTLLMSGLFGVYYVCVCCRCRFVKMISSGTAGVAVSGSGIRGVNVL